MASLFEEGIIETFGPAAGYPPNWYSVKVQGKEEALLVHGNRINEIGLLRPGDKIKFRTAKVGPYGKDGSTYIVNLQRVPEDQVRADV